MSNRQRAGRETWHRLLDWDRGQADAERLAGHILNFEGFTAIDPSHPLGGKDGLKDAICSYGGKRFIAAAFFARGQQEFKEIKEKFEHDAAGVTANKAEGIAFVTNQELRLGERSELEGLLKNGSANIFHLERIAQILDRPPAYGVRHEFLDIEMNKEEQVSFFSFHTQTTLRLVQAIQETNAELKKQAAPGKPGLKVITLQRYHYDPYSSQFLLGGPRPFQCSCGNTFLVKDDLIGYGALNVLMPAFVTCPSCGKTVPYRPEVPPG